MKIIQKLIICFFIAVISLTSCNKKPAINDKQSIYFQFEYVNYAWGYQHTGFLIDHEGKILTFKNPENWNFTDEKINLTESQVRDNLEKCKYSGKTISSSELKKYVNYIKNISSSKITAIKNVAADAGTIDYICYLYSADSNTYKGFLIKKEGDFTCENLNFYSKKVSVWLKNISDSLTVN